MSEITSSLLCSAISLISGKVRTPTVARKDDPTLPQMTNLIVRELDEIKHKLDGLARRDLCNSLLLLSEGVSHLRISLKEGNSSTSESPNLCSSVTKANLVQEQNIFDDAIMQCESQRSKGKFTQARYAATRAFCSEFLSIEDRILASKLRIASAMLEHLDDLEIFAIDCLQYIQEIHTIPAIQNTFLLHFRGGLKSLFKKSARTELIKSVIMINLFLVNIIKLTKRRVAVFDMPMIECDDELVISPIYYEVEDERLELNAEEREALHPWDISHIEHDMYITIPVLNSNGDLVCLFSGNDEKHVLGKLNTTSGKLQQFSSSIDVTSQDIEYCSVAVDNDDQVYVLSWHDSCYKLSVYTKDGILSYHRRLTFLEGRILCYLAVTKEKKIVICCENDFGENIVYLYKMREVQPLQNKSEPLGSLLASTLKNEESVDDVMFKWLFGFGSIECMFISCNEEIVLVAKSGRERLLYILTQDGELQNCVRFRARKHHYWSMCYNRVLKSIVGLAVEGSEVFVDYLSAETGELQRSHLLFISEIVENPSSFHLISHRNGAVALVGTRNVLMLQASERVVMI